MNVVQIHLMLNHAPVIAPLVAAVLLATGFIARSQHVMRVGLAALVAGAIVTLPVFFTGEPVEEVAKKLAGVNERQIETHEDAAKASVIFLGVLGTAALVALLVYRRRAVPAGVGGALLLLSLVAAGQVAWTAHLGGQIRHTEIQSASAAGGAAGGGAAEGGAGGQEASEGHDEDDD